MSCLNAFLNRIAIPVCITTMIYSSSHPVQSHRSKQTSNCSVYQNDVVFMAMHFDAPAPLGPEIKAPMNIITTSSSTTNMDSRIGAIDTRIYTNFSI